MLALREIQFGNRRFSEIARNTGAPRDRLALRLKSLVAAGILERREYRSGRYDYHLSPSGTELGPVLSALRGWGERWVVEEPPMIVRHHDHDIELRTVCGVCGEPPDRSAVEWISNSPGWSVAGPESG